MPDSTHAQKSPSGVCPRCGTPLSSRGICPACVFADCLRKKEETPEVTPIFAQIGGYEILEKLARGGMGIVFKARQKALNRVVAIKMLMGGRLADTEAVERFRAEAAAVARLRHAGIVAIHETGQHEGHHWFSMDFIDGPSLAELIKDGPIDPGTAAEYIQAVAIAVEHAHQQGVLHRDLKPSNILLDSEGRPHVTDFGLTREAGGDSEFTATGEVIGTPGYLPPEQAAGKRDALAPSCDVYGLGATLYHLLTGRPPFVGATLAATLKQVLHDEPVRPSKLNPRINAEIETICLKCLEKEPARRYASAREMAEDLGRWLRHEPILARPGNAVERLAKWARRHRALAMACTACAGLLVMLLALLIIDNARVHRSQHEAKLRLAEALIEQARAIRLSGQSGQSREALRLLKEAGKQELSPELSSRLERTLIAALAQPDIRTIMPEQMPLVSDFMHVALDPDFTRCVVQGAHGQFALLSLTNRAAATPIPRRLNEADQVMGFSPDGRYVIFRHKIRTEIWDTTNQRFTLTTNGSHGPCVFSSDGQSLARGETNETIGLYQMPEGHRTGTIRLSSFGELTAIAWTSDASNVIVGSRSGVIEAWEIDGHGPSWKGRLDGEILAMAANSSTRQIACITRGDHLISLDADSGSPLRRQIVPSDESSSLAYSPDGQLLVVGHQRDGIWLLDGASGGILLRDPGRTWKISFDREGRRLGPIWERNRCGWIEYTPSRIARQLTPEGSPGNRGDITFDPTGRWLASPSGKGVTIWDVRSGRPIITLATPSVLSLDWNSRNGSMAVATRSGLQCWHKGENDRPLETTGRTLLEGHKIHSIRFSPCGRWLAAADVDHGVVRVFTAAEWTQVAELSHLKDIDWCEFSPDSETILAGSQDPPARAIWRWRKDSASSHLAKARPMSTASVVRYSPNGQYMIDCGEQLLLHATAADEERIELPLQPSNVEFAAAFRHDDRVLAATQNDSEIHLVDLISRKILHILEGKGSSRVNSLAFAPTGRHLAAMRERGEVQLWDLEALESALQDIAANRSKAAAR